MPIILWLLGVPLSVVITAAPSFIRSRRLLLAGKEA
jgi:hypothetical protein